MSKLIALFAVVVAGALAAVLFFWRKSEGSWDSVWSSAKDSTSEWSTTAAHESGKAADSAVAATEHATTAFSELADQVKGGASEAAHQAGEAAEKAAATADDATAATTNLVDEVKGGNVI